LPQILVEPTPDCPFTVMVSSARMPRSVRVPYVHVAVIETDGITIPKMMALRARGVCRIVWRTDRPQHVGGPNSAAERSKRTAMNICFLQNRLHLAAVGAAPISANEIMFADNETTRREFLKAYASASGKGLTAFLADSAAVVRDESDYGVLVTAPMAHGSEPVSAVIVKCPSSGETYALRVPPHMRSAREAVAWTFGLAYHEYRPVAES
jgi:hypothetical protein